MYVRSAHPLEGSLQGPSGTPAKQVTWHAVVKLNLFNITVSFCLFQNELRPPLGRCHDASNLHLNTAGVLGAGAFGYR